MICLSSPYRIGHVYSRLTILIVLCLSMFSCDSAEKELSIDGVWQCDYHNKKVRFVFDDQKCEIVVNSEQGEVENTITASSQLTI